MQLVGVPQHRRDKIAEEILQEEGNCSQGHEVLLPSTPEGLMERFRPIFFEGKD